MRVLIIHDSEELYLLLSQYLAIEWPQIEVDETGIAPPDQPRVQPYWKAYDAVIVGALDDATALAWFNAYRAHPFLPSTILIADEAGKAALTQPEAAVWLPQQQLGRASVAAAMRLAQQKKQESTDATLDLRAAIDASPPPVPDGIPVHRDTGKAITIRGYRLLSKVGEGGMASVFLAERLEDKQHVVLKILDSKLTQDDEQLQRFVHEFAMISQFNSPHIVKIHDQGFTDDHVFIAMEYFERGDLKQRIQQGVTRRLALQVLCNIGRALEVIHARGIIHRDLKPQNVMFRADGTLAVADFGISKESIPNLAETLNSSIMGTPFYISPEMIDAMKADERSDLYSLGVIFYEMLMGRRPYEATSVMMLLYKHAHEPVPRLPAKYAEFQPLVDQLLAKQPEQRFQNAGAMLAFLNEHWHAYLN